MSERWPASAVSRPSAARHLRERYLSPNENSRRPATFYLRAGKRILDVVLALAGLMLTSPILLACAVAIRLDSPGPIFFQQWRMGQNGKLFRLHKLRTMVHDVSQEGPKVTASGDARITRVGRWLRRRRIDELPQLVNVLNGDMSLVGPRPEVPEYRSAYRGLHKRVLDLKPGCTGPTTLAYIDEEKLLAGHADVENLYLQTVLPQKLGSDLGYVQTAGFLTDLKIIFTTLGRLLNSA
jgi:lipopolysaccharide/colanic/teichoic acid biosynthesis glycosyltransferase